MYQLEKIFPQRTKKQENLVFNYGPQHPVTSGSLRLKLILKGERVIQVVPELGYVHRGVEKLLENSNLFQCICLFDRLGSSIHFCQELVFINSIEDLLDIEVPWIIQLIRVIFCECERVIHHLVNLASVVQCIGGEAIYFHTLRFKAYFFQFCRKILNLDTFFCFSVPGGITCRMDVRVLRLLSTFMKQSDELLSDVNIMLFNNGIFKQRTQGIGKISKDLAMTFGLIGPNARASGIAIDMREDAQNHVYQAISFRCITFSGSDVYSRCALRFEEIKQSIRIVNDCLQKIIDEVTTVSGKESPIEDINIGSKEQAIDIEALNKLSFPFRQIYRAVESPRGELGVYSVGNGSNRLYRCKINAPSFKSLQILPQICKNCELSDIGIIFKSLDISTNEIDR